MLYGNNVELPTPGHQGPSRDNVARGTSKGQTFGKRYQAQPECNNGIRSYGLKKSNYVWEAGEHSTRPSGRP
jgi:hypothetical protein